MTTPVVESSSGPVARVRWRHLVLAVALFAVAGLRAANDDMLWTAVFALAGLGELWLRRRDRPAAREARSAGSARPADAVIDRSLLVHRRAERLWLATLVICICGATALLLTSSVLAVVVAVLALLSLLRVRRERRSVETLLALSRPSYATGRGAP